MTLDPKQSSSLIVAALRKTGKTYHTYHDCYAAGCIGPGCPGYGWSIHQPTLDLADDLEAGRLFISDQNEVEIAKRALFPGDARKWYDLYQQLWARTKSHHEENALLRQIARVAKEMDACNEGWLNCSPGNECQDDHAEGFRDLQKEFHEALAKLDANEVKL